MAENMKMGEESTIGAFIRDFNAEDLTFDEFYLQQVLAFKNGDKVLTNFDSLLVKYMPEIKQIVTTVDFPNEQYQRYRYNPKLLSYDLYGTTELWALILDLNELTSVAQFNIRKVKLPNAIMIERLRRIKNLEEMAKNHNAEEVSAALLATE